MTPLELKARRAALGMSQSQLAAALGITTGRLEHWEAGRREFPPFLYLALDALAARLPPKIVGDPNEMLTPKQAAVALEMTEPAVRSAIYSGRIEGVKRMRGERAFWRISRRACNDYLQNRRYARDGSSHGGKHLTEEQVRTIMRLRGKREAIELATEYGVTNTSIWNIWNGVTWKHLQQTAAEKE